MEAVIENRGRDESGAIVALVLAAGTSSRFGRPKQLLELDGKPLLQHVVDLASACFDDVIVVLGHEAEEIAVALDLPDGVRVVVNPDYEQGQSTSLRAGLEHVPDSAEAVAILLGDQPRLDPGVVRRVLDGFRTSNSPVVRPRWRGAPGHPVVIARRAFGVAATARGDAGLRGVLASEDLEEIAIDHDPPVDVDTWDEYQRLRRD